MKSLKNKLIASTAMLLIAAIMLTSASFAWYTVSKSGDISEVKVEMQAYDNLEIAVAGATPGEAALGDTGNQQTWGGTAVYGATASLAQLATFSGLQVKTADYGVDNRLKEDLVVCTDSVAASYANASATPMIFKDGEGNACAAVYDFWIRSNKYDEATIIATDSTAFKGDGMTVKLVKGGTIISDQSNTDDLSVLGTWYESSTDSVDVGLTSNGSGYYVAHVYLVVFVNGDNTGAAAIDSDTDEMPEFVGHLEIVPKEN